MGKKKKRVAGSSHQESRYQQQSDTPAEGQQLQQIQLQGTTSQQLEMPGSGRQQTPVQQGPPSILLPTHQQQGPSNVPPLTHQQQGPPTPRQQGPPTPRQQGPPTPRQQGPPTPLQQGPPTPRQQGPPASLQGQVQAKPTQGGQQHVIPKQEPSHTSQSQPPAQIDVPGDDGDVIVTKGFKDLSLRVPPRKNMKSGGTSGRKTIIETNHLALDIRRAKANNIIHYDVSVDPDKPKRLLRIVMEQFQRDNYPDRYPAFDGKKNLYSSGYLPFQTHTSGIVNVQDEESKQPKQFKVTIKFANMVNLDHLNTYMARGCSQDTPMDVIQAVDVVLREASASSRSFEQVGRSFFSPPSGQPIDLGDGYELWYGIYQSAILGWRPFVNIDVAHKGFSKPQNVVDLIYELFKYDNRNLRELTHYQINDLNKYLKTLKIDYELPNQPSTKRCYRVNRVAEPSRKLTFLLENGKEMTVCDYFRHEKKIKLQFPDLPCLHVGSPNRQKPIYVPVELCTVKSQAIVRKMNEEQTSIMIKVAATNADTRKRKIMDALNKAGFNMSRTVQEFGFSVSDQFEKVTARILAPPTLEYCKDQTETPMKGVWRAKYFHTGAHLQDWVILNLCSRNVTEDVLRRFHDDLRKAGGRLGMKIEEARPSLVIDCHPKEMQRKLEKYLTSLKGIQLVIVVVPNQGDTYAKVKQIAELQVGVLTQCLRVCTMKRMNIATASNIILKVNSKLKGTNHCLHNNSRPQCLLRPVMIVGADVTHPSPGQTDIPSVAAVCASHDPKAFCYSIQYRLQDPRQEIIKDLQNIMREHLLFFFRQTKYKPEKIIFYRDGVSEGQFAQVLNEELQAIRRACQTLENNYQPKITFIVVQKRHHTRFFPLQREDMDGKNGNVPPGTVVDTDITHPTEMDFYLVSHASIQGTSRPTKYRRLWDDSDMSEDELEQLTYYLCHMFSRCTRAVSYPAPTYYAHLAAYRARVYIEGQRIQLDNLPEEQRRRTIQEVISKGSPMFFV